MTGLEMINWIVDHAAEDLRIIIQHRDSGGYYNGYDEADPVLWNIGEVEGEEPNCIIL